MEEDTDVDRQSESDRDDNRASSVSLQQLVPDLKDELLDELVLSKADSDSSSDALEGDPCLS